VDLGSKRTIRLVALTAAIVALTSAIGPIPVLAGASPNLAQRVSSPAPANPRGAIRIDQLGYLAGERKVGYLLSTAAIGGAPFQVRNGDGDVVLRGRVGRSQGPWNGRYRAVHELNFSALDQPGTYRLTVRHPLAATSPPFRIRSAGTLFLPRVADAVAFFQAQRDGAQVIPGALNRQPAHLHDRTLQVYDWPTYEDPDSDVIVGDALTAIDGTVDLEGGWFDAGDFIKFTHTTAYAVGLMYAAQRDLGDSAPPSLRREARFGQRWLQQAWDAERGILYIQVGIGSGNQDGTFFGDHDLWRLPEMDDGLTGSETRYLRRRPAFRANDPGSLLPPNLAGRMAAALALAAQTDAASSPARARRELALAAQIYARAKTQGVVEADIVTALPHAFYPESSWRDDMEWGAAELALAGQRLHDHRSTGWLRTAATWARRYIANEAGSDTFNLYDTSALAHADLVRAMRRAPGTSGLAIGKARLLADLRAQIRIGAARAADDPFHAGAVYNEFDAVPHTYGLVVTARLFRQLTGVHRFDLLATQQRDWALGANPWGISMMVGVGTRFPQCMQHVVANLSGSTDGTPPIVRGAVVNGPNSEELFTDGLGEFFDEGQTCPADGIDRFARFNGRGSVFVDDVRSWMTVEPAIDFTAAALLAFALMG
jgi:hypothetical protein